MAKKKATPKAKPKAKAKAAPKTPEDGKLPKAGKPVTPGSFENRARSKPGDPGWDTVNKNPDAKPATQEEVEVDASQPGRTYTGKGEKGWDKPAKKKETRLKMTPAKKGKA